MVLSTFLSSFILDMVLTWYFVLSTLFVLFATALYNHAVIWPEPPRPASNV
jgi:hypothetical protein